MKKVFSDQISPRQILALLVLLFTLLGHCARADQVYNSGPILPDPNGGGLWYPNSDQFTLSGSTPLAAAVITVYSPAPVTSPLYFTYLIQQTPTSTVLNSGNVNFNLTSLGTLGGNYLYQASFPVGGSYTAGSYFLSLSNSASPFVAPGSLFWQYCNNSGPVASLQLYSTSVIPEPADIPWLTGSVAAVSSGVLVLRNRRKNQPRA